MENLRRAALIEIVNQIHVIAKPSHGEQAFLARIPSMDFQYAFLSLIGCTSWTRASSAGDAMCDLHDALSTPPSSQQPDVEEGVDTPME